jgi:hypothetical protein
MPGPVAFSGTAEVLEQHITSFVWLQQCVPDSKYCVPLIEYSTDLSVLCICLQFKSLETVYASVCCN